LSEIPAEMKALAAVERRSRPCQNRRKDGLGRAAAAPAANPGGGQPRQAGAPAPGRAHRHGNIPAKDSPEHANRHGLITGATGTGKTVTLQVMAERFSAIGVPVFMADVKGDLAGISQ